MSKINLNTFAKIVAEREGLVESLSIAQVKEVISITLQELSREWHDDNESGVIDLLKKAQY